MNSDIPGQVNIKLTLVTSTLVWINWSDHWLEGQGNRTEGKTYQWGRGVNKVNYNT